MITEYQTKRNKDMLLRASYDDCNYGEKCSLIAKKENFITEFFDENEAYIFISKNTNCYYSFLKVVDAIILSKRRNYQIDIMSFVNEKLSVEEVLRAFVLRENFHNASLYSSKEKNKDKEEVEQFIEVLHQLMKQFSFLK